MSLRRTKIVATLGPASDSREVLCQLVEAGLDVARLNFSHGNHQEHLQRIAALRQAAREQSRTVAVLLDTKGPEIRTGPVPHGGLQLETGQRLRLVSGQEMASPDQVSISYPDLARDVQPGNQILIDDGLVALEVEETRGGEILCRVLNGGLLGDHKGVNIPGVEVRLPAVTEKDRADLKFGVDQEVDFVAASFIRSAADVHAVRRVLEEYGAARIPIIAKIESRSGVENLTDILRAAEGIMVARGDLGVEIPPEEVPLVQKELIRRCNRVGKPVITATQMLDSMMRNPRPTRAEASDVANAVFDGSDAIMLSGETASGKYPLEALRTMDRIVRRAEAALPYEEIMARRQREVNLSVTEAIGHASVALALDLQATAIITPTASGSTARMVAKYRPPMPIVAVTHQPWVRQQLCLAWGVYPLAAPQVVGTDEMIEAAVEEARAAGFIRCGDLIVVTAGVPAGVPGTTNLMKVHVVGRVMVRGTGLGNRVAVGVVRVVRSASEALENVREGDILVTSATNRDFVPAMERAAGVITEQGGLTSHAAVVALHLGKAVVVGATGATRELQDGTTVTVDSRRGLLYEGAVRML